MTDILITVQDQILTATPDKLLVSHSVGEATFEADFDESWDGYAKTIIFATPHTRKLYCTPAGEQKCPGKSWPAPPIAYGSAP